jgi:hypothetical protein
MAFAFFTASSVGVSVNLNFISPKSKPKALESAKDASTPGIC